MPPQIYTYFPYLDAPNKNAEMPLPLKMPHQEKHHIFTEKKKWMNFCYLHNIYDPLLTGATTTNQIHHLIFNSTKNNKI